MISNVYEFRRLFDNEVDQGYQILCDAIEWLRTQKIDLWTNGISRKVYGHWQARGSNYALLQDGQMCFVISAMSLIHPSWKVFIGSRPAMWLRMAAVANQFRHCRVGEKGFNCLFDYFKAAGEEVLYGECISSSQFLRAYYEKMGFVVITQEQVRSLDGMHDMTLIKKQLD